MNQGADVVLVRELERCIRLVRPRYCQLQRPPRVETRRSRVGNHQRLCLRSCLEHIGPFSLQECEASHS
jgi:hypothetical protein